MIQTSASSTTATAAVETRTEHRVSDAKAIFGFWVYIMTDCVLFASLFAVYAVLHRNNFGGPSANRLFDMPLVLVETLILLTSSFTCGLAMLALKKQAKRQVLMWFGFTFILGTAFLILELSDFHGMVLTGNSWRRSGFLSSYFALVATHGLHITIGLMWMLAMIIQVGRKGLKRAAVRKLFMLSLFWHFLDIVWIFIFTIVYIFGVIKV